MRYVPAEGIAGSLGQLARGEADICAVAISPDGSPAPGFIPYLNVPLQSVFHKDMRIRKRNKLIMAEVDGEILCRIQCGKKILNLSVTETRSIV